MSTIFSGIQPTGSLHLGNYLGAIQNWVSLANSNAHSNANSQMFFSIVDLHAITIRQDAKRLQDSVYKTLATYLACGLNVDNQNVCIFVQSSVAGHCQLAWMLSCQTSLGMLNRMTQYKSKTEGRKERECLGLYSYPVLMAADILLYDTTLVPIGEDQIQHLELTRDICDTINTNFKQNVFVKPQYSINQQTKRIMSLQNGLSKMSKSDIDDNSRINLTDSNDEITKKIKKAKTDTISGIFTQEGRAEVNNLITIFSSVCGLTIEQISTKYQNSQTSVFKNDLTEALINHLSPIRDKIETLMQDKIYLDSIIKNGAKVANEKANKKIQQLNNIFGLTNG